MDNETKKKLQQRVRQLAQKRHAIILAHYYTRPEI